MRWYQFWRHRYFKRTAWFGVFYVGLLQIVIHFFLRNPFDPFDYPLQGNVTQYVNQLLLGITPDVPPINSYNYSFLLSNDSKCLDSTGKPDKIKLLILIKSSLSNRPNRHAIRQTWGRESQFPNATIRVAFLLGTKPEDEELQTTIKTEFEQYGDIIQSDFIDSYHNITVKTIQGLKWVVENCKFAEFILFSDDDIYVSIKNLFNLTNKFLDTENYLYVGRISLQLKPARKLTDKWHIAIEDYPYTDYPPYILGGAFLVNYKTILELFYGSMYTKYFHFEDVYLGIIARKLNLPVMNNDKFLITLKLKYNKFKFKSIIASHGFKYPNYLIEVWKEQEKLSKSLLIL